jgi:hypothetical protein
VGRHDIVACHTVWDGRVGIDIVRSVVIAAITVIIVGVWRSHVV